MVQDIVRDLGYLCLGSRLRRIGERLQSDLQQLHDTQKYPVKTSHYPLLVALHRMGPLTVNELVAALGISQPGVTRNVSKLEQQGLVKITRSSDDLRRRTVTLSKEGLAFVQYSELEVWPHINEAVTQLCEGLSGSLTDQLSGLEDALSEMPLNKRVRSSMLEDVS